MEGQQTFIIKAKQIEDLLELIFWFLLAGKGILSPIALGCRQHQPTVAFANSFTLQV